MSVLEKHYRKPAEELSEELDRLGISAREFCRLLEIARPTMDRWLLPEDHPKALAPPYWITPMLALMRRPGVVELLRELHDENLMRPEDEQEPDRS